MNIFPTNPIPRSGTKQTTIIPIAKSESEGNYSKVRRLVTKERKKFELKFNTLTHAEYSILETFFIYNQGLVFEFTNQVTDITHNCIFSQSELLATYVNSLHINVDIIIEEV